MTETDLLLEAELPMPTSPESLLDALSALGINAKTHSHDPVYTVEQANALCAHLPGAHCKNLFLKDKKSQLWLVVALAESQIDLKNLHALIGASGRLSFGRPDQLWDVLGVRPGSVTPFSIINDTAQNVKVVLQQEMMARELLNYHPLSNAYTTSLTADELLKFILSTGHEPQILAF